MKVIQICIASSSYAVKDYEQDIYNGWYAQVARELKKSYPKLNIECWTIEKAYKREVSKLHGDIKFRIFPTTISVRHGMELSSELIRELKEEAEMNDKLIVHIHEYHSWLAYNIIFALRNNKNVKIICQHHGGRNPMQNLAKYKRLILGFPVIAFMQYCENRLFKYAKQFYSLSDNEINYIKKFNKNVRFQTMGIEDKYFTKINKNNARKELELKIDKKYCLYLGRIKTTKGVKELIDAAKNIDAEFLLIGDGPDFDKYKEYAGGIKNINFLGAIYGSKKIDYLASCNCLILPSYTEGAPVVLMEAVAQNLPVVATDVGGIKKMIDNKREGIIIQVRTSTDRESAVKEVLQWKKNIKKYAEKYRWKKIIKDTYTDYIR